MQMLYAISVASTYYAVRVHHVNDIITSPIRLCCAVHTPCTIHIMLLCCTCTIKTGLVHVQCIGLPYMLYWHVMLYMLHVYIMFMKMYTVHQPVISLKTYFVLLIQYRIWTNGLFAMLYSTLMSMSSNQLLVQRYRII